MIKNVDIKLWKLGFQTFIYPLDLPLPTKLLLSNVLTPCSLLGMSQIMQGYILNIHISSSLKTFCFASLMNFYVEVKTELQYHSCLLLRFYFNVFPLFLTFLIVCMCIILCKGSHFEDDLTIFVVSILSK